MIRLLIILLVLPMATQAQNDTIPVILSIMDTTHKWVYYNKSGTVAWRKDFYDAAAIPVGGYATKGAYVKPAEIIEDGYYIITTELIPEYRTESGVIVQYYKSERIGYLRGDKKRIQKPYILKWSLPVDGVDIK